MRFRHHSHYAPDLDIPDAPTERAPIKKRKKPRRIEDGVQARVLKALTPALLTTWRVYAIPNGGFRLKTEAIRLKETGVKSGITDLVFIGPGGATAWLETKTEQKGSRLFDDQIGFQEFCLRSGHRWGICRNPEEALAQCRAWGILRKGL